MTSVFSWQNSISLCPASFCTPRPNLPVTPGISWLPTFAFQSPIMKGHLFWVLVLKGLVGLHRTIQLQLLQRYWLGHRLGLPWYWMVCLGNEQRSSVIFEIASKYCILGSFVDHHGYSISSKGFLTECGPLEKRMTNHLCILALRTPWTVWKDQMIGYWKRNSPDW